MTVTAVAEGTIEPGHALHGGIPGDVSRGDVSGNGGAGDYFVTPQQSVPAGTPLTSSFLVSSKWWALSGGALGELVRISGWPLG